MFLTADEFKQRYHDYTSVDYFYGLMNPKRQLNSSKAFPLYPVECFAIECDSHWNQPAMTPDGKYWSAVTISDWSRDLDIKSMSEIVAHAITYHKYSKYHFKFAYINDIDFNVISSDGTQCNRSRLTHEELTNLLNKESIVDSFYREEKTRLATEQSIVEWVNTTPSIEMPYKLYVVGIDDSSFTQVYKSMSEITEIITKWKNAGFIDPKSWDCHFTN